MTVVTAIGSVQFLEQLNLYPVIDVRSPAEYAKGHIPKAINLPLFSNEARAAVGTAYKQQGRRQAILLGLDYVGPKMRPLLEQLDQHASAQPLAEAHLLCYCWRGGMRSQSLAWLAELYGYRVSTLSGGYKAYRRTVLDTFSQPADMIILGGKTGSGKTEILQALSILGQRIIDLEGLARHRGSAFGGFADCLQPTQQQFENELAQAWQLTVTGGPIWLEDESRKIGEITIPEPLCSQMRAAPILFLEVPLEMRVSRLVAEYGQQPLEHLTSAILKIKKRLGGHYTQLALTALGQGDLATCCAILLEHYYDKAYLHSLARKKSSNICCVSLDSCDPLKNAQTVLEAVGT